MDVNRGMEGESKRDVLCPHIPSIINEGYPKKREDFRASTGMEGRVKRNVLDWCPLLKLNGDGRRKQEERQKRRYGGSSIGRPAIS